jgi:glutamine---fructose-6-phosphate transaminase (isomerizing)
MTYMLQEIREQPEAIEKLVALEYPRVQALWQTMQARGVKQISICARGTSDNAATFGKYLLEIVGGMPVSLAAPSVFTLYNSKLDLSKWLLLGISQSGESTDVVEVVRQAREMGALTAGITNVDGSALSKTADFTLMCHSGDEKSVAATKTYMVTMGIIYMLASAMMGGGEIVGGLQAAAQAMRSVLDVEDEIASLTERYRYMQECVVVARGINLATSQEMALKLSETCYVVAKPFSAADFLHGPIATVDRGFPVFLLAPPGRGYVPMLELADKLAAMGAELIVFSSEDEILSKATKPIRMPSGIDEIYSPLVYTVAGQLFAQYLSLTKGINPDKPRGLSKVTLTM